MKKNLLLLCASIATGLFLLPHTALGANSITVDPTTVDSCATTTMTFTAEFDTNPPISGAFSLERLDNQGSFLSVENPTWGTCSVINIGEIDCTISSTESTYSLTASTTYLDNDHYLLDWTDGSVVGAYVTVNNPVTECPTPTPTPTPTESPATTTPGAYTGPTYHEWLFLGGTMLFFLSFMAWPIILKPLTGPIFDNN